MIRCNQFGKHTRLGNWLFVYAAILRLAAKTGHRVEMPEYFLWKYLDYPPRITSDTNYDVQYSVPWAQFSTDRLDEMTAFFSANKNKIINFDITCFLQSEKWFMDEITAVKNGLMLSEEYANWIYKSYDRAFDQVPIGIGIRRGDFVGHGLFYQIPEAWYLDALNSQFPDWRDENSIVIFSDDIEWCKSYYQGMPFIFAEPNQTHRHGPTYQNDPMEQFVLGTMCNHFVGGSSTFSWWQMWYVKNFNYGTVVHCGKNLSNSAGKEYYNPDYYPETWKLQPTPDAANSR